MTTNHTELCERLSADAGDVGKNYSSPIGHRIDDAVMLIEQQAARIQQQAERIAELEKERDALKADAERYRWLREQHWNKAGVFVVAGSKSQVRLGTDCPSLDRLDAAIDAALQAEKGRKS